MVLMLDAADLLHRAQLGERSVVAVAEDLVVSM
jgi:hypothetical protein